MSATEGITKLTGPETWKVWNTRFINEATAKQIWDLIDPASDTKGQFQPRPVEPVPASYPKLMIPPAAGTRASSETARATPLPEQVEPYGKPANISEMTTAGRELYRQDMANFQFNWRRYKDKRDQVSHITAWISKTVDDDIYSATCTPGKTLDVWYANLKERARTNELEERRRALERYYAAHNREDDVQPRTIAKGAFVTFAGQTPDQGDGSQRGPAQRTGKRKYTGGSKSGCPACDRRHNVEDCWSVRPEIRPAGKRPAMAAEKRAYERMQQDPELRQRVEQLRKRTDTVITTLVDLLGILERQYEVKVKVVESDNEIISRLP
ncbi:hypothetical protein C7999DRAFT_16841, partial [Corynascus novoguineensis]